MTTAPAVETDSQLATLFQYTVEAYKTFQKLAEMLPNPMSAAMFKGFAEDERHHRDLLDIKYLSSTTRVSLTLGSDLRFQDILEGELSYREIAEFLITRERTMLERLKEWEAHGSEADRNLFKYFAASKRAHVMLLEREYELIRIYPDWLKREDAESLIVHGATDRH